MLYKIYVATSVAALILFSVAQYKGWSWESESEAHSSHFHSSSSGNFSGGSHRGSYHK